MGWRDAQHPGSRGPATFQVRDLSASGSGRGSEVEMMPGPPPSYFESSHDYSAPPWPEEQQFQQPAPHSRNMQYAGAAQSAPWWKPKYWRKRTLAIVAAIVVIILIIIIVVPVKVAEANRYPDYTKLNYSLKDEYSGTSFFDNFNYFTGYDPAQGFVHYVPKDQATTLNLTYASTERAVLKVDTSVGPGSTPDASTGRFSVRLESKTQYDSGLFIFDVRHTPHGCGTWPALWLSDPNNWPTNGEIDVMEATNQATDGANQMTLHTTDDCWMGVKRLMTGTVLAQNCYNGTDDNAGCGVSGGQDSYGTTYNDGDGGLMAVEWRSEGIRMWAFTRSAIPADITAKSPDPSSWGEAKADFPSTKCDIGSHFRNQSVIANIDLCGQYAGGVYADSGCPSTCTDYVANNPSAFTDAFWEFGKFEIYQAS